MEKYYKLMEIRNKIIYSNMSNNQNHKNRNN